jgi:hypothetical protein
MAQGSQGGHQGIPVTQFGFDGAEVRHRTQEQFDQDLDIQPLAVS